MKSIKISNNEMAPLLEFYKQESKKAQSRVDEINMIVAQLSEGASATSEPVTKAHRGRPAGANKLAKTFATTKVIAEGAPKKRGRKPNPDKAVKVVKIAKPVKPVKTAKPVKPAKVVKVAKALKAEKPIKVAKAQKVQKTEKPVKAAKVAKVAKVQKTEKPVKAAKVTKIPIAVKPIKTVKAPKVEKAVKVPVVKAGKMKSVKVKKAGIAPIASEPPVITTPEN